MTAVAPRCAETPAPAPPLPRRLELELSSACNLRCTYCPRRYLPDISAFMDLELFRRIVDEMAPHPETILVLHRRGESLLHPRLAECLDHVRGRFRAVQLATNATLLDEAVNARLIDTLSFISFSLDAPETFDRTRKPARYRDVAARVERFLDQNAGRVETQVSMVQTAATPAADLQRFREIWQDKVDRVRIYAEHSADGRFGTLAGGRPGRVPCAMPAYEMLVFSDGRVGRCNHDWNGAPLGDLNRSTVAEVWNGAAYRNLRAEHARLALNDPVCRDCDSWYPVAGHQMTGETHGQPS